MVELARRRHQHDARRGTLLFSAGDMLDPAVGELDFVVAMDSLIHYAESEALDVIEQLAARTTQGMAFTIAPRTPLLALMHVSGRLFPRSNRAPDIEPITVPRLVGELQRRLSPQRWRVLRTARVSSGFYTSHAIQLVRP